MANAETRTTALLFSFSAVLLLLLARAALLQPRRHGGTLADLLLAALDRVLDGRGLMDLATRTNMILLCHAILLVILRDAGVLGTPARRRGASPGATTPATVVAENTDAEDACSAPPRPRACRSVVLWQQRPRDRAAAVYDATGRLVERQLPRGARPAEVAAPWAAPAVAQVQEPVATKQIVLVEKATRNHLPDHHGRLAVVELDQAPVDAMDGKSEFDRCIVVADDDRNANTTAEQKAEVELADDRRIEEFIAKQWRMMRQESLQLFRSRSQDITAC